MRWLLGTIIYIAMLAYALPSIWRSQADQSYKLIWSAAVIFFPVVGFVAWFLAGPKGT